MAGFFNNGWFKGSLFKKGIISFSVEIPSNAVIGATGYPIVGKSGNFIIVGA